MPDPLPDRPDPGQLRWHAKELRDAANLAALRGVQVRPPQGCPAHGEGGGHA